MQKIWSIPQVGGPIAWCPTGRYVACVKWEQPVQTEAPREASIALLDPFTGNALQQFATGQTQLLSLAVASNERLIALSGDDEGTVQLYDASGDLLRTLSDQVFRVHLLAFSPDATQLISVGPEIIIWNVSTGKVEHMLGSDGLAIQTIAWSPDGKRIAAGARDFEAYVWDLESEQIQRYHGHQRHLQQLSAEDQTKIASFEESYSSSGIYQAAWCSDSQTVVTVGRDATIQLWNAMTGAAVRVYRVDPAHHILLPPVLAIKDEEAEAVVDLTTRPDLGECIDDCLVASDVVEAAWSVDLTHIAATSVQGELMMWQNDRARAAA